MHIKVKLFQTVAEKAAFFAGMMEMGMHLETSAKDAGSLTADKIHDFGASHMAIHSQQQNVTSDQITPLVFSCFETTHAN